MSQDGCIVVKPDAQWLAYKIPDTLIPIAKDNDLEDDLMLLALIKLMAENTCTSSCAD